MIRVGLIGVGGYAKLHLDGFLALQGKGEVRIVAMADPSTQAIEEALARPGMEGARIFPDYRELCFHGGVDAVVITSPIPWHEEMVLTALECGLYVLLEKPPVPLLSQLERLIAADAGGRVMVGFQHIYSWGIQEVRRRVLGGEIGELTSLAAHGLWPRSASYYQRASWSGQWIQNGRPILDGPCTNACAHFINNLMYVGGASWEKPRTVRGEVYRARPVASYDTGCVSGALESGVRFFAGFTHACLETVRVVSCIKGRKGSFVIGHDGEAITAPDGTSIPSDDGRDAMRRHFLRFCRGDASANLTSLPDMRGYTLATNLMFQSSAKINDIPGDVLRVESAGMPEEQYVIPGIREALSIAAESQGTLREAGIAWGVESRALDAADFDENMLVGEAFCNLDKVQI